MQHDLESTGWTEFLNAVDKVYLCSPASRSIRTALLALPESARITIDEGLAPICPLGPDLRRSFKTSLAMYVLVPTSVSVL